MLQFADSHRRMRSRPFPSHKQCLCPAAGGSDADYSAFEGHDLHVVPSAATLTFEHSYTWWGNRRKLRVAAQPNVTLSAAHVPARCRRARTVLLGPLTPADVDCLSFIQQPGAGFNLVCQVRTISILTVYSVTLRALMPLSSTLSSCCGVHMAHVRLTPLTLIPAGAWDRMLGRQQQVGLMAQGLQRSLDAQGRVGARKHPADALIAALGPSVSVFLSDVETVRRADLRPAHGTRSTGCPFALPTICQDFASISRCRRTVHDRSFL